MHRHCHILVTADTLAARPSQQPVYPVPHNFNRKIYGVYPEVKVRAHPSCGRIPRRYYSADGFRKKEKVRRANRDNDKWPLARARVSERLNFASLTICQAIEFPVNAIRPAMTHGDLACSDRPKFRIFFNEFLRHNWNEISHRGQCQIFQYYHLLIRECI